jgi:hypothetical protein
VRVSGCAFCCQSGQSFHVTLCGTGRVVNVNVEVIVGAVSVEENSVRRERERERERERRVGGLSTWGDVTVAAVSGHEISAELPLPV